MTTTETQIQALQAQIAQLEEQKVKADNNTEKEERNQYGVAALAALALFGTVFVKDTVIPHIHGMIVHPAPPALVR